MRPGKIAMVKPEDLNKVAERRRRNMGEELHTTKRL
jgi:hypothetical protein